MYVILTDFPRQQWLRERALLLYYTYIACFMCIKSSSVILIVTQFVSPQIRALLSCADFMDEM
jgi:hypothetical protein